VTIQAWYHSTATVVRGRYAFLRIAGLADRSYHAKFLVRRSLQTETPGTRRRPIVPVPLVLVIISLALFPGCIRSLSPTPSPVRPSATPTPVHPSPTPTPVHPSPTPTPASQNTYSFNSDSQNLSNYWKPNSVVDPQHAATLNRWLAQNAPGTDIASFIYNNRFASQRSRAVADLGLGNR
jgi:hypothetical protein